MSEKYNEFQLGSVLYHIANRSLFDQNKSTVCCKLQYCDWKTKNKQKF